MALFKRRDRPKELADRADQVFSLFSADEIYRTSILPSFLADLQTSFVMKDFRSLDQVEALVEPITRLPGIDAAVCAAVVLRHADDYEKAGVAGEHFAGRVANAGWSTIIASIQDAVSTRNIELIRQLEGLVDKFWRFEAHPYQEFDHAQATYMKAVLQRYLGATQEQVDTDVQSAIGMLSTVDLELLASEPEMRGRLSNDIETLRATWSSQIGWAG
ncbi:hypothetical protein ACQ86B_29205 (plasmid) [Mycolicibacterium aichiense]|uniref:hypothetical protein n=1 Tax=Mycolicibacterium aichiense TaxID=1799 RepID=UPI003D674013